MPNIDGDRRFEGAALIARVRPEGRWLDPSSMARVQIVIGLLFLATFVVFAVWARFPVPYRDDWDWLRDHLTRTLTLRTLFEPHNEHLIPLPRVLFALQYRLEGTGGYFLFVVALAAQLATGWFFWQQIRQRWRNDRAMRWSAFGVTAACLFFSYQLQSIVFVAAVLFPLVQMFVVMACAAAARASAPETAAGPLRGISWAAAAIASAGAALTTTNGLVAPGIVALYAMVGGRRIRPLNVFIVLQLLCVIGYLVFVGRPWEHAPAPAGERWAFMSIGSLVVFFFSFFSSGVAYGGGALGVVLGMLCFAAGCAALWAVARDGAPPPIERFAAGLLLFAIASAAMTTIGRAQFGVIQAAQSRYATYTFVFWAALIVWALSRAERTGGWSHWKAPVMAAAVAITAIGLAIQVFVGIVWVAKTENLAFAALTLATGVDDDAWVATLHPETHHVYEARTLLAADGRWNFGDARIGTRLPDQAASRCLGSMQLSPAAPGPGLRVDGTVDAENETALITDASGAIVGLARPAPTVDVPNPLQMDVLSALRRRIVQGRPPTPRWAGFSRIGAGAPYTFHLADGDGRLQCHLPMIAGASGYSSSR